MDGEPVRKEWLDISAFGKQGRTSQCNVFEVNVEPLSGGSGVKMEVFEVPTIARVANVHPEIMKTKYTHLKDLWFSDIADKDILEVDMLVGADNLWQIQRDGIIRGDPGDPIAIETIIGWTISGRVNGPRDHHANVNLVLDASGEIAESELKRLWDLETLGICETKDVYEDLVENIQFNGERYSVKLPWKAGHQTLPSNYQLCVNRLKGLKRRLDKDPGIA